MEASRSEAQMESQIPVELFQSDTDRSSSFDSLPEKTQKEVLRRLKIIQFVEVRLKGGWTEKNLDPILNMVENALELPRPSWRTLASWKKTIMSREKVALFNPEAYPKGESNCSYRFPIPY